jgi:Domain of unknown function (DUF4258)
VSVERFIWTTHALARLDQRQLARSDVELAIRSGHEERRINEGAADWLITGTTSLGVSFEAIYDHPIGDDETTVRIISAWRLR